MGGNERGEPAGDQLEREVEAAEAAGTSDAAGTGPEAAGTPDAATPDAGEAGPTTGSGSTPDAATSGSAKAALSEPDDANDLRGYHFRELLHKPLTWVLVGGGSLLLGVILALA